MAYIGMADLTIAIFVLENATGWGKRFEFRKARIAVEYQPFSTGC